MSPQSPCPVGSTEDIVVYNGRAHSRAYAVADMTANRVPAAWIERTMAEATVLFDDRCRDERGRFTDCGSEAAKAGEKIRGEKLKAKAEEKEQKEKAKAAKAEVKKAATEAKEKRKTERTLKQVAKEISAIAREKTFNPPPGVPVLNVDPHHDSDGDGVADASRVGVGGRDVPPPPANIPRLPNLTADERLVEERFAGAYERDPDGVADKFMAATAAAYESEKAKAQKEGKPEPTMTFETDAAKNFSPDYNPPKGSVSEQESKDAKGRYNLATHQTANAIAKRAFVKYLDTVAKMPEEKRRVLVTSGGCGAGKGYAVEKALGDITGKVGACWDAAGEQNATENPWIMEECEKRGIKPTFVFVHADPTSSWEDPKGGVVTRAIGKGRMVDAKLFAESYALGAKNFQSFMDKHKEAGKADFVVIDNSVRGKTPDGKDILPKPIPGIPEKALALDAEKLYQRSANYVKSTANLTPGIYRGSSLAQRVWKQ